MVAPPPSQSDRVARARVPYLFPFVYFWRTRLSEGTLAFHVLFEWGAAASVAFFFGAYGTASLPRAFACYVAFIALYEIGYIYNDLVASGGREDERLRGPQGAGRSWIGAWVAVRVGTFLAVTLVLGMEVAPAWWLFFGGLGLVFTAHNLLQEKEQKTATFLWLAWFRFSAPVAFVVESSQRMGVALAAVGLYGSFRLLGYMDSKGLLKMKTRREMRFRSTFFIVPLVSVVGTATWEEARAYQTLVVYFACIALGARLKQRVFSKAEG